MAEAKGDGLEQTEIRPVLKLALVGAGPAGFYTAEAVLAACPRSEVDLIERLPTPFGLIRSGVAPDHQHTKAIHQTFERIARRPQVRYIGNVEVDRDVSIRELTSIYDAVVLTCGVPFDAPLDIPGAKLRGVYGAAEFVGWYNAHPDYAELDPDFETANAVIVGNGNVALDLARILSKPAADLAKSDIAAHALERLRNSMIADVHVVGRRGPLEAKFTTIELQELGEISGVTALARSNQVPESLDGNLPVRERRLKAKNLECFRGFALASPASARRRIRFEFNAKPLEVLGRDRVRSVRFERTCISQGKVLSTGETFVVPCGIVVSAIGYRARAIGGFCLASSGDHLINADGLVAPGIYVAGWLKRGPSGKIGTNRTDADEVAERIRREVSPSGKLGFHALERILRKRSVRWINFDAWKRIEQAEIAAAAIGAPRLKFASIEDMLAV